MTTAQSIGALGTMPTPNMKKQDDDERPANTFAAISQALKQEATPAPGSPQPTSAQAPDAADETEKEQSAAQKLRDYMELSPAEQIRVAVLNEMGMTEEELEKLPPEEQQAIEEEITKRIEDALDKDSTLTADNLAGNGSAAPIGGTALIGGTADSTQQGMDQAIRLHQAISFANGA